MYETESLCDKTQHNNVEKVVVTFTPVPSEAGLDLGSRGPRGSGQLAVSRGCDGPRGGPRAHVVLGKAAHGNRYLLVLTREKGLVLSEVLAGERLGGGRGESALSLVPQMQGDPAPLGGNLSGWGGARSSVE